MGVASRTAIDSVEEEQNKKTEERRRKRCSVETLKIGEKVKEKQEKG